MEAADPHPRAPIVAAFSPESAAREPVEFGLAASRVTGAPLIIVAVMHGGPLVHLDAGAIGESEGDYAATVRHLELDLERRGIFDADIRVFEDNTPARGLARALDELDPELIVLGSTRRGKVGSVLLGTTGERVVHASGCPVAIVPNGYTRPADGVQLIGAAFSPTEEGREALHAAAILARAGRARLRSIIVLEAHHAGEQSPGLMAGQHHDVSPAEGEAARHRLAAEAELRAATAEAAEGVEAEVDVLFGEPADGLVAASELVDLLVMGSRGLGPKRSVLLGGVSRKVAARAACPVLILPRGSSEKSDLLLADARAQASRPA
jgi:nucleotide-binding universal stress UspA family protein